MININLHSGQGLGNQLWVIASGYCLSLKKDTTLQIFSNQFFKGKEIFDFSYCFNTNIYKKACNDKTFNEEMYFYKKENCYVFTYDQKILDFDNENIHLEGNFQSTKYFFNFENELRMFFNPLTRIKNLSKQFNNKGILNIRGGEYKRSNVILPKSYWHGAYKHLSNLHNKSDIICVTDDYKYAKSIFPDLEIISNSIPNCFAALLGCKNICVSNSSFSFFPLFLNKNVKNVFAPYQWARFNNQENLWLNPCNFYENWKWLNSNNTIVSIENCLKNIEYTKVYFKENFQKSFFYLPEEPNMITKIYLHLKFLIKKTLGLFFIRYS